MLQLKNETPFVPSIAVFPNQQGIDTLYVAVKATFDIGARADIAQQQQPLRLADEWWGEPGQSSLKYASEVHLSKPTTDVIIVGEACLPGHRPVQQLDVAVSVGGRNKIIRVFGERVWDSGFLGMSVSTPQTFETMPLIYERAFGGVHVVPSPRKTSAVGVMDATSNEVLFEERNSVGKGFTGRRSNKEIEGMALPNLEDPAYLIAKPKDRPAPACFGFVAPSWFPRKNFVGTYDAHWQKTRAPYLPADFDMRFFNAASPDLQMQQFLHGGEVIEIVNMSPDGRLRFALPHCELNVEVRVAGNVVRPKLSLETVLIEPTDKRLSMIWRAELQCDKQVLKVEQVTLALARMHVDQQAA